MVAVHDNSWKLDLCLPQLPGGSPTRAKKVHIQWFNKFPVATIWHESEPGSYFILNIVFYLLILNTSVFKKYLINISDFNCFWSFIIYLLISPKKDNQYEYKFCTFLASVWDARVQFGNSSASGIVFCIC